jgi:hypothetical protein
MGNKRMRFSYTSNDELRSKIKKEESEGYIVVDFDLYLNYWSNGDNIAEVTFESANNKL